MKLPLAWLKEFVPKLPPIEKLVEMLLMHGLEVEEVIDRRGRFQNVLVGEVIGLRAHPNADKLRLAMIRLKPNAEPQEVVCGAPNIAVGQKVAVALVGAKLPSGMTIEAREIRGVRSNGMVCSERELGLSNNHGGIMVLDATLTVGMPLETVLGVDEVVFDIAMPANRADLMSVRGLAREIAAILGQAPKLPAPKLREGKGSAKKSLKLKVQDTKLNPVLTGRVVRDITMKASPPWLVKRLRAAGLRSVHLVVDVTNYVMWEYGQPLHAYDADKLEGGALIARRAKAGEMLQTLDGQQRKLTPDMLVICDAKKPVDLAGVMGGRNTEVTPATKNVVLEAAVFNPVTVRKTSRKLGLVSEASKRFEKGVWPSLTIEASAAAAGMLAELGGGKVEKGIGMAGVAKTKPTVITFNPTSVAERLGLNVSAATSKTVLTKLGFKVTGAKLWKVTVPEWRLDVRLPEDLIDEVGRIIGYDSLPSVVPHWPALSEPLPAMLEWKRTIRQALVGLGFTEVITHSYYGQPEAQQIKGQHVEIANPLDAQQQFLRRSLVPAGQNVLRTASDTGQDARIFEIGRVFLPEISSSTTVAQPWKLLIGVARKAGEANISLQSYGDELFRALHLTTNFQPPAQAQAKTENRGRQIEVAELDVLQLLTWREKKSSVSLSKYPVVRRAVSAFVPATLEYGPMLKAMMAPLGKDARLLDQKDIKADWFTKDGKKSITIQLPFRALDRTLTRAEVDQLEAKMKAALKGLGAIIR